MQNLVPTKPYFVRAVYSWCVDNGLTPYLAVAVDARTHVPRQYVHEGQIVLNVAPYATHQFEITNEALSCQARFGGVAQLLYIPLENILAIYAKENGRGLAFEPGMETGTAMELGGAVASVLAPEPQVPDGGESVSSTAGAEPPTSPPAGGSHLRVVK